MHLKKKPIVTSLVHFYAKSTVARDESAKPSAAIVTALNADGTVNLFVFHTGEPTASGGIARGVKQGDPVVNRDGKLWCWPTTECVVCEIGEKNADGTIHKTIKPTAGGPCCACGCTEHSSWLKTIDGKPLCDDCAAATSDMAPETPEAHADPVETGSAST